jgi:hypothetical protein
MTGTDSPTSPLSAGERAARLGARPQNAAVADIAMLSVVLTEILVLLRLGAALLVAQPRSCRARVRREREY